MTGGDTIRKRKETNDKAAISKSEGSDYKAGDTSRVHNQDTNRSVAATVVVGLILSLAYANYSSPIAGKPIEKAQNREAEKWASVENADLKTGMRILHDLGGPESVAVDSRNGNCYTGTVDGRIVRISNIGESSQTVTDLLPELRNGPYTAGGKNELRRPLGLRMRGSQLFVADAYQGILAIDVNIRKWEKIVGYNEVVPEAKFSDDLVLNNDGTKLYFTDMSEKWPYHEMAYSVTEGDCSGRVFEVDMKSKVTRTLRKDMCFPNGIELNPENTVLVVSESQRNRIVLLDTETGQLIRDIPMPGNADNVRRSKFGGYWVPIPSPTIEFLQITRNVPAVRNIVARILGAKWLSALANFKSGMVVKLDDDFKPVAVYKDTDGEVSRLVTEVAELENGYLLGSFHANGLVKIERLPVLSNVILPK